MRKHQQNQILELLRTLQEAHGETKRLFSAGQTEAVVRLLADCQDGAAQIGNFIEQLAGEGTKTVVLLEEYCELLYKASKGELGEKALRKQLIKIDNCVRDELKPDRIEVVFFPYQLSMFDAFESVYLAAKEDPDCDVYCVPIPWFERNNNGSLGKMHYDGDKYPAHVNVTDWLKYDVENRRPDVIFVHNAYDGNNYVTSVHPDYYCNRLSGFTDNLVFIPYFVSGENPSVDLLMTPGLQSVHKIIAPSVRLADKLERHYPKNKILPLGSPKIDAALKAASDLSKAPQAWLDRIGGGKAVFLNTSIGNFLKWNERYLDKLGEIFALFQKRDDVVLLWRPHPLLRATAYAMRPGLVRDYDALVERYRAEDIGIYDETPDPNCMIAISDAYIGDYSSMVFSFAITGKPIFYTNANCRTEHSDNFADTLLFPNLISEESKAPMSAMIANVMGRWNTEADAIELVSEIPNETGPYLYVGRSEYKGRYVFAPLYAEEIGVFDSASNIVSKIPLPTPRLDYTHVRHTKFVSAHTFEKYVYLLPYGYPGVLRLDMETNETLCMDDWLFHDKAVYRQYTDGKLIHMINGSKSVDGIIYAAFIYLPAILCFDCRTGKGFVRHFDVKCGGYVNIAYDGENLWLAPFKEGAVLRYNPRTGDYAEFSDTPGTDGSANEADEQKYSFIHYSCGYVWIFSISTGRPHVRLDPSAGLMTYWDFTDQTEGDLRYLRMAPQDDDSLLCTLADYTVLTLSFDGGRATMDRREIIKVMNLDRSGMLDGAFSGKIRQAHAYHSPTLFLFNEAMAEFTLPDFLDRLDALKACMPLQVESFKSLYVNADGTAGEKIYAHMAAEARK